MEPAPSAVRRLKAGSVASLPFDPTLASSFYSVRQTTCSQRHGRIGGSASGTHPIRLLESPANRPHDPPTSTISTADHRPEIQVLACSNNRKPTVVRIDVNPLVTVRQPITRNTAEPTVELPRTDGTVLLLHCPPQAPFNHHDISRATAVLCNHPPLPSSLLHRIALY